MSAPGVGGRCHLIQPHDFDTEPPLNLNDVELSPLTHAVTPYSRTILTDSTAGECPSICYVIPYLCWTADIVRLSFATEVRNAHEAVVRRKDFDYDAVLTIDAAYRRILESLPTRWSSPDEPGKPDFQRHFIVEGVNNRLFRLHRPFSTRGYMQERYAYSTVACLKSAREIIVSTSQIHDSVLEISFSYSHCFSATLVLFNE